MIMYVKLFASLYQGTLRGRSDEILVFTNLLAHADRFGIVDKHWRAISEETGLTHEQVKAALLTLESPDPESRSPEREGRRIIRLDEHRAWGWQVVNYEKYRAIRSEDDRREANRAAQERWRNRNKPPSAGVSRDKPPSAHAEGEVDTEAKNKTAQARFALPEWVPKDSWQAWIEVRSKMRAPNTPRALELAVRKLEALRADGYSPQSVLDLAVERGWRALYEPKQRDGTEIVKKERKCSCGRPLSALGYTRTSEGDKCTPCWNVRYAK